MDVRNRTLGGYCGGVPPLPIPNREVKPTSADGTAMQCGRVGNRLLLKRVLRLKSWDSFFCAFFLIEDNPLFFIVEHYGAHPINLGGNFLILQKIYTFVP